MQSQSGFMPRYSLPAPSLRTTAFDRTAAALCAVLSMLGTALLVLAAVWITNLETVPPHSSSGHGPSLELVGSEHGAAAALLVVQPPEVTDDPSVEVAVSESASLMQLLSAVAEAPTDTVSDVPGAGQAGGNGTSGTSISSPIRPPQPPAARWVFRMRQIAGTQAYARMLDQFDIELGTFDAENQFVFVRQLSGVPQVRHPQESHDPRFYTTWQSGTLLASDLALLEAAGIRPRDGRVLHFFSPQLESRLAALEAAAAAPRSAHDIRRTWFDVVETGGRFEFRVSRQRFRE